AGGRGPGGPRPYGDNRGPRPQGERGPRREGGFGGTAGDARPQRQAKPYGHPGNAPHFPSDHAHGGGFNPYGQHGSPGDRPRGPRPGGNRPNPGPRGPRPGGNGPGRGRGPRGNGPR
ncbi:MAG: pseudouridine synthase, partial [Xanthomonadales bacterium]|nr:pseudouridine synthase [Xanthomonadales bacterium]